jgi:hypothetical protein
MVQVMSFINTMIEAPPTAEERVHFKEDLQRHGMGLVMGGIRGRWKELMGEDPQMLRDQMDAFEVLMQELGDVKPPVSVP